MSGIEYKISSAFDLFDKGEYLKAEKIYNECLNEIDKSSGKYNQVLHGMGYVKSHLNKFADARDIYKELKNLAKNVEEEAIAIHQMGMVERMAKNYEKALHHLDEELRLLSDYGLDNHLKLSANFYERAYIHLLNYELKTAEKLMNKSLVYAQLCDDKVCLGCSYRGLGEVYKANGNNSYATECFERAIMAFREANDQIAVREIEALMK